jgi:transposase
VEHYAGLDVSLELTSVCIVDAQGEVVREAKVASEPEALIRLLRAQELEIGRVGLEPGPLSQWLHAGLIAGGFEAVLLETRHVKAALSAMTVKTDRRDARGIAQLLRLGWFRPVHAKSANAQEVRSLLTARKLIQAKLLDAEFKRLHRAILELVRADPVCRQLMSVPGVGAIVPSPSEAGSMIRRASSARAMSVRTLASRHASTSRVSSTSPVRSARSVIAWSEPRSTKRPA